MPLTSHKRTVCIALFDEVEVLDFCGPFEVFSVTGGRQGLTLFEVCTVAEKSRAIKARGGLSINPAYSFEDCPQPDILLIVSAGISAGIDMSLHVVARLLGEEQALETAQYMEYQWRCKDSQVRRAE